MDLNKSIKKAKRKQLFRIVSITILGFILMTGTLAFALDKIATNNYHKLDKSLFAYQTIASPNTQIDSQVISNSTIFGGEVVTNQSKNIDGYIVPWSSLRSRYNVFRNSIDYNELAPSWYHSTKNSYEYNRQTKQKVASFYNPNIKNYYDDVQNELSELTSMDNYVAEVALSFDKPYTYSELKKMIPDNINVVWLYLFSEERDESVGPSGMPVYGFQLYTDEKNQILDAESDKDNFFDSFETHFSTTKDKKIAEFIQENKDRKVDELPIWGIMVTGQAKNLLELENNPFIRGSSIGVTAPIVPYISPEK